MAGYQIVFTRKAEKEYLDAFYWYEERLKGLGLRFEICLDNKLNLISKSPLLSAMKSYGCRESKIEDFPYLIVYKIYPDRNLLTVISVFHTSRNPKKKSISK